MAGEGSKLLPLTHLTKEKQLLITPPCQRWWRISKIELLISKDLQGGNIKTRSCQSRKDSRRLKNFRPRANLNPARNFSKRKTEPWPSFAELPLRAAMEQLEGNCGV